MSERLLIVGDQGTGKTSALFSIAVGVLASGNQVFFFSLDAGADRFIPRVKNDKNFHYQAVPSWLAIRNKYRASKSLWNRGDWLMFDRADMGWPAVQEYQGAALNQVTEEELDDLYLSKRAEARIAADVTLASLSATQQEKGRAASVKKSVTQQDFSPLDWGLIRGSFKGVFFDACGGDQAVELGMNVAATCLAQSVSGDFMRPSDDDPRFLASYGIKIKGQEDFPTWFETLILSQLGPQGYTIISLKDRERKRFPATQLPDAHSFLALYQDLVGIELLNKVEVLK